ncbi:putative ribonuclease H-like domain-containing protein [Tanacetum coccineum]|uniref:Ribonuclease H-like domain-containing protein n=1 Tax=Tanacetum coccineum TaxID=301880 RepID=A0ABQ4YSK4_9ASTR
MTGNKCYLTESEDYDGGFVSFGDGKGRISGKERKATQSLLDHLGKFDGKADEGFFVRYSVVSKAMRVFNKRTGIVEETLNIRFLKNAPNVIGNGLDWLFDVDSLTISMNYVPVVTGNQTNGPKDIKEDVGMNPTKVNESRASDKGEEDDQDTRSEFERLLQQENSTNKKKGHNNLEEHCLVSYINKQRTTNHKDYQNCLFACFLSQKEHKKVIQAVEDPSWIDSMQEGLPQFKLQKNPARLVGHKVTPKKRGMIISDVFAPVARIEAIRLFLAYASYIGFIVYQMDVKSAFLYGTVEEEVYVCQSPSFEDPHFPDKVYKVEKALYGLHQAPRAWYETLL